MMPQDEPRTCQMWLSQVNAFHAQLRSTETARLRQWEYSLRPSASLPPTIMSSTSQTSSTTAPSPDPEKQAGSVATSNEGGAASAPAKPALTFPEGGTAGWLTVLGAALILFSTFGAALSFGVFQDYYTREFLSEHTPSEISWIGSAQLFLDFSVGLPAGKLFDDGHFRLLMIGGTLIYLFSFFMLSITQPHHYYQVFLSQGIGMGIGMGLVIVPAVSIPAHYFRQKRSLAMGFVFAGSSLGGVLFPIILNRLINGRAGFAWGVRAAAFLTLGLLVIGNILMRPRLPTKKQRDPSENAVLMNIMKDKVYWISVAGAWLVFWGLFFPYFYLQLFAVLHGIDPQLAFYSITVLNAATIFGRTLPNFAADKLGPINVAIPMTTISGALIFAMFGATSVAGMFCFAIFYGFFSGAFISLLSAIMASLAFSVNEIGSRIGIAMFAIGFALLTGTPITGALLRPPEYAWWRAILFSGIVILAGVGLLVVARSMVIKRKKSSRV
ncbi:hypothetical protein HGRIS_014588 [Hohenbuehelia grisea]|uniref:Major facilitator superfamily (MFS) profile domain-containing protein n=1 Tax=Hohenbuehelia grisea TaxID=104357 RepID=A0ABR3JW52_9AGAR